MSKARNQARGVIRSTADRLSDIRHGEARSRRANKTTQQRQYQDDQRNLQRRYKADPQAVLSEHTWTCTHCGSVLEPSVYDHPLHPGDVLVIPKSQCGCDGETAALEEKKEQANRGTASYEQMQQKVVLNRAGLTGDYSDFTFANYKGALGTKEGQRKDIVREYCDALLAGRLGSDAWLVMWGPYGTGKTHLGAAVLHEAIKASKLCYLRIWPDWLESIQATFGSRESSGPIIQELKRGHVVMIDDIDKYPPSKGDEVSWAQSKLYTALANRHKERRPTILTFNHEPREMVPWLGASIVDRMLERTYAVIHCTGESWRSGQKWEVKE